jgi:hypothetical protein
VCLRHRVSLSNLRDEKTKIIPSTQVSAIELWRPQLEPPVVRSLLKDPPTSFARPPFDDFPAYERALPHHFDIPPARLSHAQDKLVEHAIGRKNFDLVLPIASPDLNVFAERPALLDVHLEHG